MSEVARDAYDKTAVGAVGWMRPDAAKGQTVEGFQAVALAADALQNDGLIRILAVHEESTSGRKLIDAIQFKKLR